jgi:hypothetical protein
MASLKQRIEGDSQVKINNLTNGLVATLLLASPIVGAETEYPAADFKPKVIYQDIDNSQSKSTSATASAKQAKPAEVDSKYPAADFEPKVLYKDSDYKPNKFTGTSTVPEAAATTADVAVSGAAKVEEESMLSYLLGLAAFAVAAYMFLSKRDKSKTKVSDSQVYSKHISGLSGVARYLRKHNMSAMTGVARYLESQVESAKGTAAASGVEKYLERQAKSAKEKAAQAGTGVEKYMRNRG